MESAKGKPTGTERANLGTAKVISNKRFRAICPDCGSTELSFDACANWDEVSQTYKVIATYDNAWCNADDCPSQGHDTYADWEEVEVSEDELTLINKHKEVL